MQSVQAQQAHAPVFCPRHAWMTRGQQALLVLLLQRIRDERPVTTQDVVGFYQYHVQRDSRRETFEFRDGEPKTVFVPLDSEELKSRALDWLRRNLGALVVKGFLKVVPRFEIEEVES